MPDEQEILPGQTAPFSFTFKPVSASCSIKCTYTYIRTHTYIHTCTCCRGSVVSFTTGRWSVLSTIRYQVRTEFIMLINLSIKVHCLIRILCPTGMSVCTYMCVCLYTCVCVCVYVCVCVWVEPCWLSSRGPGHCLSSVVYHSHNIWAHLWPHLRNIPPKVRQSLLILFLRKHYILLIVILIRRITLIIIIGHSNNLRCRAREIGICWHNY